MKEKQVKKITLGIVLSWIFSLMFGIGGLGFLFGGVILGGCALILASLILFPPMTNFLKTKFNFELSGVLKVTIVFILFLVYAFNLPSNVFKSDATLKPTKNAQESPQTVLQTNQKIKSATLSIDKIQVQVANLYPTRITVTNTGDVSISPNFDLYVYKENIEVCSGSPILDNFGSIPPKEKKTDEISIMGCTFKEDGEYTLKIDLLDEDYSKMDVKTKTFTVSYWNQFR